MRFCRAVLLAEGHGSKAHCRNLEARLSQLAMFHCSTASRHLASDPFRLPTTFFNSLPLSALRRAVQTARQPAEQTLIVNKQILMNSSEANAQQISGIVICCRPALKKTRRRNCRIMHCAEVMPAS